MLAGVDLPAHLADVIAFGSVMDCSRLGEGFRMASGLQLAGGDGRARLGKAGRGDRAPSPRAGEYELPVYCSRGVAGERQLKQLIAESTAAERRRNSRKGGVRRARRGFRLPKRYDGCSARPRCTRCRR